MDMKKVISALAKHEKYTQADRELTKELANCIESCQLPNKEPDQWGVVWKDTDEKSFPKTHLWHAFRERMPSDCGYGMRILANDEIEEYLSEGGCDHCLRALHILNADRLMVRRELGKARRLIRRYGKAAILLDKKND